MQKEAVLTTEGPLLILAGAGSGKTRVLVHRMAYLIEQGVDPFNILAITFTNKAAKEMKERAEHFFSGGERIWVSTFHSMCIRILRREIDRIGYMPGFTIFDTSDTEKLMKEVLLELNLNDEMYPPKLMLYEISNQKNELISPQDLLMLSSDDFKMKNIARIYEAYQNKLKLNNALDFDDLIYKTVELFLTHKDVLERYQHRFRYIMVDEYQDTNIAQYQLIRFLSSKYQNLCVVGDDDQSIYGWRGANIQNILDFEKDFAQAKVIKLEQNYRSTSIILEAANSVIKNNFGRKEKKLWTENNKGNSILYYRAESDTDESVYVADFVLRAVKLGASYKDFAVLYRTNSQSRIFEEVLFKNGTPYRLLGGGIRFYERREINDLLAYLKIIVNPSDDVSLKRIINVPKRGIGLTTISKFTDYALNNGISFFSALKKSNEVLNKSTRTKNINEFVDLIENLRSDAENMTISALLRKILDVTDFLKSLQNENIKNSEEGIDRVQNVQELISKAIEFESQSDDPSLIAFLEDVALVADIDNYNKSDDAMVLMTLHSAKGLEFPTVFIVGFEENIFPSYSAIYKSEQKEQKEMEEERRLCYVGITRAKQQLILTTAVSRFHNGKYISNKPSRFLKEIPQQYIQGGAQRKEQAKKPRTVSQAYAEKKGYVSPSQRKNKSSNTSVSSEISKEKLTFSVGDHVVQSKYGEGEVIEICNAGADYEVTILFQGIGRKKFMAHLSNLKRVDNK